MIPRVESDARTEWEILSTVRQSVPYFSSFAFKRNPNLNGSFDFSGWKRLIKLDVKDRNIPSDKYPSYPISVEKIEEVEQGDIDYWIIYRFTDRVIRIYHLNSCRREFVPEYRFKHYQHKEPITRPVWMIDAASFWTELYLMPHTAV